jgi:hypothetical protein
MRASIVAVSTTAKPTRLKIGLLAATVCTTALVVGAGTAAADPPDEVACTFGSSDGNVETCLSAAVSGLFVGVMTASACVEDSTRTLQVCIHRPDSEPPLCSAFEVVSPGNCIFENWFPDGDVPGGDYCARTWRDNADGSHTLIGEACLDVHQ